MKNTLIALTTATVLGAGALAAAPAAAAPLAPAQLAFAVNQTANGFQLASHQKKKKNWKNKWSYKKHNHSKPYWHAGKYWHFVGPHGYYPGCFQVPGGFYCTY